VVELLSDGVHLDPATVRTVSQMVGNENIAFATDAMAAASMPDGFYQLGPMAVVVDKGVARLATSDGTEGAIAGGTARLIDEVKLAVATGVPLISAVRSASLTPAEALGLEKVGSLSVGNSADILVTSAQFDVSSVFKRGELISEPHH
jgi:N-acetylglucosamine-6-phosphate deacetylase